MFEGLLAPTHLLIIIVIAMVVFGPKRLPELARSLGSGMRTFKDEVSGLTGEDTTQQSKKRDQPPS